MNSIQPANNNKNKYFNCILFVYENLKRKYIYMKRGEYKYCECRAFFITTKKSKHNLD
jgi:hypothetical protein